MVYSKAMPIRVGRPYSANKNSRPHWDGRESRGTTQIDHYVIHLVLTIISLPCNAGIAVQTTNVTHDATPSPERLGRELRSGSAGWEFQPVLHTSLAAFADVLSSVVAFIMLGVLSAKNGMMSRANRSNTL